MAFDADSKMTKRDYLLICAMVNGATPAVAKESVASVAMAYPEWDMDRELKWFHEWNSEDW